MFYYTPGFWPSAKYTPRAYLRNSTVLSSLSFTYVKLLIYSCIQLACLNCPAVWKGSRHQSILCVFAVLTIVYLPLLRTFFSHCLFIFIFRCVSLRKSWTWKVRLNTASRLVSPRAWSSVLIYRHYCDRQTCIHFTYCNIEQKTYFPPELRFCLYRSLSTVSLRDFDFIAEGSSVEIIAFYSVRCSHCVCDT